MRLRCEVRSLKGGWPDIAAAGRRIRVVFKAESVRGERVIFCVYVNFRPVVYELFEQN